MDGMNMGIFLMRVSMAFITSERGFLSRKINPCRGPPSVFVIQKQPASTITFHILETQQEFMSDRFFSQLIAHPVMPGTYFVLNKY